MAIFFTISVHLRHTLGNAIADTVLLLPFSKAINKVHGLVVQTKDVTS